MKSSIAVLVTSAAVARAALYSSGAGSQPNNHTCQLTNDYKILSCSPDANPSKVDSCCVETYGGLLLATQFWNTYTGLESSGQLLPKDTWTLHGLWPDFCNGSYTQYCDLNRQYDPVPSPNTTNGLKNGTVVPPYKGAPIDSFFTDFGRYDLLEYMRTYWINQGAPNWYFWGHEFSKHATCYSTFDVPCYGPQYRQHEDVIDFAETAIKYYRRFPTWKWLSKAGITPCNTTTYTVGDIQKTLTAASGAIPYIGCSGPRYNNTAAGAGKNDTGFTVLSEVWYYQHAYGRPQDGKTVPVNATGSVTNCAKSVGAVNYYERTPSSVRKTNPKSY